MTALFLLILLIFYGNDPNEYVSKDTAFLSSSPDVTIKRTCHFKVKAEVSEGTIRWDYLLEVKQRYKVELSAGITI